MGMRDVLAELIDILALERIEENIFRGRSQDLGWGRVFGGQVLGQALSAAEQTVPDDRPVHSLHGYFMRPGDASKPIVFTVDPIRDGRSFTTRRVVAIQDGKAIFNLAASFQVVEDGFDHQACALPEGVPGPDELISERELGKAYIARLPEAVRNSLPTAMLERVVADRPIELRPIDPVDPLRPDVREPHKRVWFKASGPLPERRSLHNHMLCYASDFHLLGAALQPHAVTWLDPRMQVASLDHAMWFHREFRFDDWVLYDIDSETAQGARGLARGRFFARDGRLIATTIQEGLMRKR